jgi:hypothetical protein
MNQLKERRQLSRQTTKHPSVRQLQQKEKTKHRKNRKAFLKQVLVGFETEQFSLCILSPVQAIFLSDYVKRQLMRFCCY